ncbi:MAG: hypothetical protein K0R57_6107 [Paenibacillaceae bacterium]|jgi:hypothetical protein|nr:hypothetical protein [Paenibacillaceae bacterium]
MEKIMSMLFSIICAIALAGCWGNFSPNTLPSEPLVSAAEPPSTPSESDTQGEAPQSDTPAPSQEPSSAPKKSKTPEQPKAGATIPTINIQVGNKNFTATLHDNESARTIVQEMPFTLKMDDFASQEKVTDLTFALPSARAETPASINAGDIYLWSGNNLVLFYTTFSNSYSYVPVGYITDVTGLTDALGSGSVEVTFSMLLSRQY